jgi:hypothetical protein
MSSRYHVTRKNIFIIIGMFSVPLFLAVLGYFLMRNPYSVVRPEIIVRNMRLCTNQQGDNALGENDEWVTVEEFHSARAIRLCAVIETDISPVNLRLVVHKTDSLFIYYPDSEPYTEGSISFALPPELDPGQYRAAIMYSRFTLAELFFEAKGK